MNRRINWWFACRFIIAAARHGADLLSVQRIFPIFLLSLINSHFSSAGGGRQTGLSHGPLIIPVIHSLSSNFQKRERRKKQNTLYFSWWWRAFEEGRKIRFWNGPSVPQPHLGSKCGGSGWIGFTDPKQTELGYFFFLSARGIWKERKSHMWYQIADWK